MCGIAGKLNFDRAEPVSETEILRMLDPMKHRGPDGHGVHLDGNAGLGHLRLSIIDLCTGAQPMANEDETVWIVFNGEIYNFHELRDRLVAKGHVFRSKSDTEVIIHAYEEFGPDCVNELRGMFAFAIWDSKRRRLFIARDRVGIKPLYYTRTNHALLFASELKALMTDASVGRSIDHEAMRTFLAFNYVPGESTLFGAVRKLLPGHYLICENGQITIQRYWDLKFTQDRYAQTFDETVEELRTLLQSTVRDHMIADVPVGVLLSGGVDSSAVLSFAVSATNKKINTFTVGFDGNQVVDERPYARSAAEKFGAEHREITITEKDFWNFLPEYVWHMEEPVCEPPAVALYYVSRLARQYVKVVLSGEGGDEAFGGYPNYPNMLRADRLCSWIGPLSRPVGALMDWAGSVRGDERLRRYGCALRKPLREHYFSRASSPMTFFNRCADSLLTRGFRGATTAASPGKIVNALAGAVNSEHLLNQMLYIDSKTWLPDDLLVKADKITMANSLELRVPLLDHKVLEFAASLPPEFKVRGKETKRVLKAAFAKVLPPEILTRKKAGFPVPYESWLSNGLCASAGDVLLSDRAVSRNYFEKRELERVLKVNSERGGFSREIFCLVTLELWHRKFADQPASAGAAK
jgi:asparagine synthase (glutamine-hydrolysing)